MQLRVNTRALQGAWVSLFCLTGFVGASKPLSAFLPDFYDSRDGLPLDTLVDSMFLNSTPWRILHDFHIARLTSMSPHEVPPLSSSHPLLFV